MDGDKNGSKYILIILKLKHSHASLKHSILYVWKHHYKVTAQGKV